MSDFKNISRKNEKYFRIITSLTIIWIPMTLPHLSTKLDGTMYWFKILCAEPFLSLECPDLAEKSVSVSTSLIEVLNSRKSSIGWHFWINLSQYSGTSSPATVLVSSWPYKGPGQQNSWLLNCAFRKEKGFLLACSRYQTEQVKIKDYYLNISLKEIKSWNLLTIILKYLIGNLLKMPLKKDLVKLSVTKFHFSLVAPLDSFRVSPHATLLPLTVESSQS